LPGYLERKS